eukprot:CAMPEP_0174928108 /NCGR_PEP_ID=MMETSP1355-20121228/22744_1 /TAXON_ID=464990 /ORGANISM="Hemiselmis tepida, Strain CCMP443" /LENGTH=72 /DNA_ID=CAMNT_0016174251 /DNA_START=172 /DNA_END=387 /DNA_ORIENTATION=+
MPRTHLTHSGRRAKNTLDTNSVEDEGGRPALLLASARCLCALLRGPGMEPLCDHRTGAQEGVGGEGGAKAAP